MNAAYPESRFFLWIHIKDIGCSSDDFIQYALEHYKLPIISGSNFGELINLILSVVETNVLLFYL